jgi:hypothetical protein
MSRSARRRQFLLESIVHFLSQHLFPVAFVTGIFPALALTLSIHTTQAGSATWDLNPGSGDWNTAANWTPMTVPNGSADTATFGLSNTTGLSVSANTEVNSITFTSTATNPYTITANPAFTLTLSGAGIINNSGVTQNFVTNGTFGQISFTNNATAGTSTIFTNNNGDGGTLFFNTSTAGNGTFMNKSGTLSGLVEGFTEFFDTSTAGNGTFTNAGSAVPGTVDGGETVFNDASTAGSATINNNSAANKPNNNTGFFGGITFFGGTSTAGNATITNNGGTVAGASGGLTFFGGLFGGTPTAGNATITNNGGTVSGFVGGGTTRFVGTSTADSATLIANGGTGGGQGGTILFEDQSTGGTSRIEVFGNGNLDISFMNVPHQSTRGVTVGSIEGDGNIFLGGKNLTVGSSDLSTAFSGVIQDGGKNGGAGGSLTKIGTGTLILSGADTYTCNTDINGGALKVNGSITSNTRVVPSGTLAGNGTINGNVINNGRVSPGDALGTLTINGNYTNNARLLIDIAGANSGQFSLLDVVGSADLHGFLDPVLVDGFTPTIGQSFTFLDYASLTGAFSGIQDAVFNDGTERWVITYQATDAVLTATKNVPELGSTLLLLMLSLLGLATYRLQTLMPFPS